MMKQTPLLPFRQMLGGQDVYGGMESTRLDMSDGFWDRDSVTRYEGQRAS